MSTKSYQWVAYAPIALALDYCRLGWAPTQAFAGTRAGEYSVLMVWQCECPLVVPVDGKANLR